MKHSITAFLFFFSLQTYAAQTSLFQNIVGNYEIKEELSGFCPKEIAIKVDHFSNESAPESLSIYCSSQQDCERTETDAYGHQTRVVENTIYQMININSGLKIKNQTNPMTGFPMGYQKSFQTFNKNILRAEDTNTNIFGVILWKTTFEGHFDSEELSFKKTEYNVLTGKLINKMQNCIYQKM